MRESMATLTPRFSTNRAVREYTERYYLPAAAAYRRRAADRGTLATRLVAWQRDLSAHWREARFGAVRVDTREGEHHFTVDVHPAGLLADAIRVELFADSVHDGEPLRHMMTRGRALEGSDGGYEYTASVPVSRPAGDYTPRLLSHHPEARTPLEAAHILWQR
jgi:starch phosphorylase